MAIEKPNLESRKSPRKGVSLYLTERTLGRVKELADKKDLTSSEIVELLMEWALDAYEAPEDPDGQGDGSAPDSHPER